MIKPLHRKILLRGSVVLAATLLAGISYRSIREYIDLPITMEAHHGLNWDQPYPPATVGQITHIRFEGRQDTDPDWHVFATLPVSMSYYDADNNLIVVLLDFFTPFRYMNATEGTVMLFRAVGLTATGEEAPPSNVATFTWPDVCEDPRIIDGLLACGTDLDYELRAKTRYNPPIVGSLLR